MRLLLGGPAYRMEVDARHCASLINFATAVTAPRPHAKSFGRTTYVKSSIEIVGSHYEHGTPVAYARNQMFKFVLESVPDADRLLWLDADCSIPADQHQAILRAIGGAEPLTIIPCAQRDGAANVWTSPIERLAKVALDGQLHACHAGGFGAVAFNLEWYRASWSAGPWFQDGWSAELGYTSEDYGHCRALAERGQVVRYAGTYVDHRPRGGG